MLKLDVEGIRKLHLSSDGVLYCVRTLSFNLTIRPSTSATQKPIDILCSLKLWLVRLMTTFKVSSREQICVRNRIEFMAD